MIAEFSPQARDAVRLVYDTPGLGQLATRLEEIVDELEAGPPYSARLRGRRMQTPKLWYVSVHGSGERFALMWTEVDDGDVRVVWAGPAI